MALTVLSVAYPFAPVGPDAVGGAEQVLAQLDEGLVRAGHRSIVVACKGSRVVGTHVPVPAMAGLLKDREIEAARARHRRAITAALQQWPVDLVHMHGVDFHTYLPPEGVPVLATLHLPINYYPSEALHPRRPDTWINCVSRSQHATSPRDPQLLAPIENGVAEHFFMSRHAKRRFALLLARICPEKGVHLAMDAAKRAGIPLLIAGEMFPYTAHHRYFVEEVQPRLDRWRRFIGPIGLARKRRLLAAARCLLVPSLVAETSSLVAREALASGTPVVAFARGALGEILDHGQTGFLVRDVPEMAEAITRISAIDSATCRSSGRARLSLDRMMRAYISTYQSLRRSGGYRPALGAA